MTWLTFSMNVDYLVSLASLKSMANLVFIWPGKYSSSELTILTEISSSDEDDSFSMRLIKLSLFLMEDLIWLKLIEAAWLGSWNNSGGFFGNCLAVGVSCVCDS